MNVLLDECVPVAWAGFLNRNGHHAVSWPEVGQAGAGDDTLSTWARDRGWALLTSDTDFGQRLWLTGADCPTVIQLAKPGWLPETHGLVVLSAVERCQRQQPSCYFVRITGAGPAFKMIRLPLGR